MNLGTSTTPTRSRGRSGRRRTAALAALTAASLILTGCTHGDGKDKDKGSNSSSASGSSSDKAGEITLKTSWGDASYPKNPKRVIATGTAVDNLLALGIKPSAIITLPSEKPSPWLKDKLKGVKVITAKSDTELPAEAIASDKPDLIVGDYWRITEQNYNLLKNIAPTLGATGTHGADIGWASQLTQLGKLFGKEEDAKKVIAEDHKRFEETKKDIPGLAGKTGVVVQFLGDSKQFGVVADPKEPGNSFLYDLGMTVPDSVLNLPNNKSGRALVSGENIKALNADFMAVYSQSGTDAEMRQTPGYSDLTQVRKDSTKIGDAMFVQGLNVPSSLSREWLLKELRPQLKNAAK